MAWNLRFLDSPQAMAAVENLQRLVWTGDETEIVPVHMLLAVVRGGGVLIGAYQEDQLIGFVFGFPGLEATSAEPQLRHCSHMAAVHPDYRDEGLGFALKRAQWQMVRQQGFERITWTYDPLQSRNARLNITKLGAVCNTYAREYYGEMRDGLNRGLPTDRFEVDWWLRSKRVEHRLSKKARPALDLAHFISAGASILNPTELDPRGLPLPHPLPLEVGAFAQKPALVLVEIPADFSALAAVDLGLAVQWRLHTRQLFEQLFELGYLVTDFTYLPGSQPRSFYVLSHGEATL